MLTPLEQDFKAFYEGDDTKARVIMNRIEPRTDCLYSNDTVDVCASVGMLVLHNNPTIDKSEGVDLSACFEKWKDDLKVR